MNAKENQSIAIELNTKGISTIPSISPENIITIHGKNGVGKSMAATLLEIASGNYTFKNEKRFKKLANSVDSSEISFKNGDQLLYQVNLQPHVWRFDNNLNRVNPYTLGKFYEGENGNVITFKDFKKKINVRTIRGDESLQQQVHFFKDIFIAKIKEQLEKLESKIHYLESYEKWLKETIEQEKIQAYQNLQENYNNLLNRIGTLKSIISNKKANIRNSKEQSEFLEKLLFISENKIEKLKKEKKLLEEKSNDTEKTINSNYETLSSIKQTLDGLKGQYDEKTQKLLKRIEKLKREKATLENEIKSSSFLDIKTLDESDFSDKKREIETNIERYTQQIKQFKKKIETLNKKNERIIQINKYLTRLRDISSKASSHDFGKEKLIEANIGNGNEFVFSFEELYEIFNNNNMIFKESQDLKNYKGQVSEYNKNIKESRETLDLLTEYNKCQNKIKKYEQKVKGKTSKLDDYIDLDKRIKKLEEREKEIEETNSKLKNELLEYKSKLDNINKRIDQIKEAPSKNVLLNELKNLGIRIDSKNGLKDKIEELIPQVKKELTNSTHELEKRTRELKETEEKIEKLKEKIGPISQKIKEAAKIMGFSEIGEFISYYETHDEKVRNYIKTTNDLNTRLKVLREDIERIIEGQKPRNKNHLEIVNTQFDRIFKELYGKEEFFEYVFKDYTKINKFDIAERAIHFETPEGFEETRDLEEFSSGEKTYAYCRSIISMTADVAEYNFVILDESYALLDREHSEDLYQFQEKMVKENKITKFINLLPLKEDLETLSNVVKKNIEVESKRENPSNLEKLNNQLSTIKDFRKSVEEKGYYQEILYPKYKSKVLNTSLGITRSTSNGGEGDVGQEDEELPFRFILDGSNIARNSFNSKRASIRDVIRCKKKLIRMGLPEKYIFIIFGAGVRHHIPKRDEYEYEKLIQSRNVNQAPAGRDDDWYIIKTAFDKNGYIITNDRYYKYREKYPKYEDLIENRSIHYVILGNDIQFDEGTEVKIKELLKRYKVKSKIREI